VTGAKQSRKGLMVGYQEADVKADIKADIKADVKREREQQRRSNLSLAGGAILFWILMVVVAVRDYQRDGGKDWWEPVLWETSSGLVVVLIFYAQSSLLFDHKLLETPRLWFVRILRYLPLVCISFVVLTFGLRHAVYALLERRYEHEPWLDVFFYESVKLSIFMGLFYMVIFGVRSWLFLLREKVRAERATQLFQQAQLRNLNQQLQPHFLFNALNTISSLMYSDLKAADQAVNRLADLLRHQLDSGDKTETTVAEEIALLRAYAELMQLRFVDRVELRFEIDPAALHRRVPSLCLQILLENTFKHTVEKRSGLCRISIAVQETKQTERTLTLSVEDDLGVLPDNITHTPGIGLDNLRQRLALMKDAQTHLQIQRRPQGGVRTEIVITTCEDEDKDEHEHNAA
jgi:two-component system, LytTR family, sensor kinase